MTFWIRQNYRHSKKISGCQVFGVKKGWIGQEQKILRVVKLSLCYYNGRNMTSCVFVKTKEIITPNIQYSVNHGLHVIMMCQWRFISFNKCTTILWGMLVMGETMHFWYEAYRRLSVLSSQFCYEPKTFPRNNSIYLSQGDPTSPS